MHTRTALVVGKGLPLGQVSSVQGCPYKGSYKWVQLEVCPNDQEYI